MASFLHAMNDIKRGQPGRIKQAIMTLDLSQISPLIQDQKAPELAWGLLDVLDHTRRIQLAHIPNKPKHDHWTFHRYPQGSIDMRRQADGRWLFSAESLHAVPAILDELTRNQKTRVTSSNQAWKPLSLRLRESIPETLRKPMLWLEAWQWLGIAAIVIISVLGDRLTRLMLGLGVRQWRRRQHNTHYQQLGDDLLRPFALLLMAAIWWGGLNLLSLPAASLLILLLAAKFLAAFAGVWALYRLVDLLSGYLGAKAADTENKLDDALVPLLSKSLKLCVTVIGIVFIADTLNMNVTGLLAGLGLGGLAFALAAKDVVENLFGSITVLLDRPFHVGDWVVIGDVEGTVETVGFRSTRIRTFYNSVISLPNSRMITAHVDNMGSRQYRRLKTTLGIAYDTPATKVDAFCAGLRELVMQHPHTRKDYFQIWFNNYSASSLDILVYIFFNTPDWTAELKARHEFLLSALKLAEALGIEYAYPTQTLYLRKDQANSHQSLEDHPAAPPEAPDSADRTEDWGRQAARGVLSS